MQESELTLNLKTRTMRKFLKKRTRNRKKIYVSSRTGTGTGRNMDPLQPCFFKKMATPKLFKIFLDPYIFNESATRLI